MAKVYLDTNKVIDIAERLPEVKNQVNQHQVFTSALSIHILCYVNRIKLTDNGLDEFLEEYYITDLGVDLLEKAIHGPTKDLEDNIQLHSAAEAECDYFLTADKNLLKMKYFGKTKIVDRL